jgi:hypothetical protein
MSNVPDADTAHDASAPEGEAGAPLPPEPALSEKPLVLCFRCGYSQWREHTPGIWVCGLCGIPPAVYHS